MMRGKIFILLMSIVSVGCNYRKNTDVEPNIEVPTTYAEGREVPPPPEPPGEKKPVRDVRWWRHMSDPTLSALIDVPASESVRALREGLAEIGAGENIDIEIKPAG